MAVDAIYSRRSIRKYKNKEVSKVIIDEILEAGMVSPSGKNKQPWKFIVFGGDKKAEILAEMEKGILREQNGKAFLPNTSKGLPDAENTLRIMKEAPIVIMVLNPYSKSPFEDVDAEKRISEIVDSLSIGAAIENMLLKAEDLGIGTLWIGNTFFAYNELVKYLNTDNQLVCAIALGYSDETPMERPRKTKKDTVIYYL